MLLSVSEPIRFHSRAKLFGSVRKHDHVCTSRLGLACPCWQRDRLPGTSENRTLDPGNSLDRVDSLRHQHDARHLFYLRRNGRPVDRFGLEFHRKQEMHDAMLDTAIKTSLESAITCPKCDHQKVEVMPTDSCVFFYECTDCKTMLKPLPGDCCVFCSYGSIPCPPKTSGAGCC